MTDDQSPDPRNGFPSFSVKIAMISTAAALPPVAAMGLMPSETSAAGLAGALALGACASFALGWLGARPAAAALRRLSDQGPVEADLARRDEVGQLARTLSARDEISADVSTMRQAFERRRSLELILDERHEVRLANGAAEATLLPIARRLPGMGGVGRLAGLPVASLDVRLGERWEGERPLRLGDRDYLAEVADLRGEGGKALGFALTLRESGASGEEEPVRRVLDAVASGDFSVRLPALPADGARSLGAAANRMTERLDRFFEELAGMADAVAGGRLSHRMRAVGEGRFETSAEALNGAVERVGDTVGDIGKAADGLRQAADMIAGEAANLSARTEAQASSLEEAAATMEEMAANVRATATNADAAETLAREAASGAEAGKNVMADAVAAMARIEESATKISDIISVIDAIAFQTNLLALNAAVEAARAGEAGKGFAVVAAEVRTLAQRSSQAAKDISGLIQTSSTHVGEGVRLVQETGGALEGIAAGIARTAGTIGDISAAVREQSAGVQETSQAVSHMDEATQQNSSMAEQSAAAARRMQNEARWLIDRVGFFEGAAVAASPAPARIPAPAPVARPKPAPRAPAVVRKPSVGAVRSGSGAPAGVVKKPAGVSAMKPVATRPSIVAQPKTPEATIPAAAKPTPKAAIRVAAAAPRAAAPAAADDDQDWTEF